MRPSLRTDDGRPGARTRFEPRSVRRRLIEDPELPHRSIRSYGFRPSRNWKDPEGDRSDNTQATGMRLIHAVEPASPTEVTGSRAGRFVPTATGFGGCRDA